jgi:hypothetical protein
MGGLLWEGEREGRRRRRRKEWEKGALSINFKLITDTFYDSSFADSNCKIKITNNI